MTSFQAAFRCPVLSLKINFSHLQNAPSFQLHLAVRGRHKEVVRNLMERKADPNIINSSGKLPTSLARDKEMKNILTGKFVPPAISSNGNTSAAAICEGSSASGNLTPTMLLSRKRPYSPSTSVIETPTSLPLFKESPGD